LAQLDYLPNTLVSRNLSIHTGLFKVVAIGMAYSGTLKLDEDFVLRRLLDFDVVTDLENAARAGVFDPSYGLLARYWVGSHIAAVVGNVGEMHAFSLIIRDVEVSRLRPMGEMLLSGRGVSELEQTKTIDAGRFGDCHEM
jgi:hypothetical protein